MRRKHPVTDTLIAVNVLVFLAGVSLGMHTQLLDLFSFSLEKFLSGRYTLIITSSFFHTNPAHLGFNLIFLHIFGHACEEEFGGVKTLGVFAAGMFAGALLFAILFPAKTAVGASAGIFGLMAASILVEPGKPVLKRVPLPISLLGVVYIIPAVANAMNLENNIANIAHVGGAIAGSLLAFAWDRERAEEGLWAFIGFALLVIAIGVI